MNNISMNNTMNNTTNNTVTNPLVQNFISFVNSYSKIDKIDDDIIDIVNKGFKTYNKFSVNVPAEADMYIKEEDMNKFCLDNINDETMIPITLDDPRLVNYIKIYKDMKTLYVDNCDYLLGVLEKKILKTYTIDKTNTIDGKNETTQTPHFTLNNVSYDDLLALETDVRNRLVIMYSTCHEQYQKGMVALFNGLKPEENL